MDKKYLIGGIIILVLIGAGAAYSMRGGTTNTVNEAPITKASGNNNSNSNSNTLPEASAPTAVTSSSATPTDTTVIVSGNVNPKGSFTSYWYEYGSTVNMGNKTSTQTMGSGFVSISAPAYITNLIKSTTYYFRLVAENKYGKVSGAQYSFKTSVGNPPPVGSAPTSKTLAASGISNTTANINGEVTPNKSDTQYWFEYGNTSDLGNTSAFASIGSGSAKVPVSISLSDLKTQTTYYYRLNAQNQFGTINGSILNFKTTGPAAATAPKVVSQNATAITETTATLRGTVNPNGAETKYWFEYSKDSLLGSVSLNNTDKITINSSRNVSSVEADISSLDANTRYYFRLVAENSEGTVRGDKLTFKTR